MPKVRIVADENIPRVSEIFRTFGTVETVPGRSITREKIASADVLLVRSVTRVSAALLNGTNVRFVGSATIGTDHIETSFLTRNGIAFVHAPASNADSVVEYVLAALLRVATRRGERLQGRTVGIVGCGSIGSRLARRLPELGLTVLKNDPPLALKAARDEEFIELNELLARSDIVTLHVPYTAAGRFPTRHLIDHDRLRHMRRGAWLLNTSRGAAVDNDALRDVLAAEPGRLGAVALDVWENEPLPDVDLIARVDLATPHVAGYSVDGKLEGALMLYDGLAAFLDVRAPRPQPDDLSEDVPISPPDPHLPDTDWLHAAVLQMYQIASDDHRMRQMLPLARDERSSFFERLRREYPDRRAFAAFTMSREHVPPARRGAVERGLGVRLGPVAVGSKKR